MAVDPQVFRQATFEQDTAEYNCDIAFLGKMYQTEYQYFKAPLNEYLQGYLEGIIGAQMKIYGGYLIPELVTQQLLDKMNVDYAKYASDGFQMGQQELEYMLACEVTGRNVILRLRFCLSIIKLIYILRKKMSG